MSTPKPKFVALNASAARIPSYVAGNPVNTRLESGVGNCFPGLEMDLRNLERRFFPFVTVDFVDGPNSVVVTSVDTDGLGRSGLPQRVQNLYQALAQDIGEDRVTWTIDKIAGSFGPFGRLEITVVDFANAQPPKGFPPDAWTAVRLLPEGEDVEITLGRRTGSRAPASRTIKLKQPRVAYLDADGVFAEIFEPGELSQSLCSPWTHDFRDCACFYWASNHPDIVQPPAPEGREDEPRWQRKVPWERADRGTPDDPSPPATPFRATPIEMDHYEINSRWQELDIAVEGREIRKAYQPGVIDGRPFQSRAELESELIYAAGVELAAAQVYLSAAYSLKPESGLNGDLKNDVISAFAELMRVAISEMRHLRVANDVLRALNDKSSPSSAFRPALRVALEFPPFNGTQLPVAARALTPDVLQQFIEIEKPSLSVDGLYARILSTLEEFGFPEQAAAVRSVMAEGTDHYQTFLFVNEWLGRHPKPSDYLNAAKPPSSGDKLHVLLQKKYRELLQTLRAGYAAGLPRGAAEIATARRLMLAGGLQDICEQHRSSGLLVVFDVITDDAGFSPIERPQLLTAGDMPLKLGPLAIKLGSAPSETQIQVHLDNVWDGQDTNTHRIAEVSITLGNVPFPESAMSAPDGAQQLLEKVAQLVRPYANSRLGPYVQVVPVGLRDGSVGLFFEIITILGSVYKFFKDYEDLRKGLVSFSQDVLSVGSNLRALFDHFKPRDPKK
jgi:hypothetical protein